MKKLFTLTALSEVLNCSRSGIKCWRKVGITPFDRWCRIGRNRIIYPASILREIVNCNNGKDMRHAEG